MTERVTCVHAGNDQGVITHREPVSRNEALIRFRIWVEQELAKAQRQLAALDAGDVKVFHQTGIYAAGNRREVTE